MCALSALISHTDVAIAVPEMSVLVMRDTEGPLPILVDAAISNL